MNRRKLLFGCVPDAEHLRIVFQRTHSQLSAPFEVQSGNGIFLYSDSSGGNFQLVIQNGEEPEYVSVTDISGKEMLIADSISVDLSSATPGLYFVVVITFTLVHHSGITIQ